MNTKRGFVPIIVGLVLSVAIGVLVYVNKKPFVMPSEPANISVGPNQTSQTQPVGQNTSTKPASGRYSGDDDDDEWDDDDYLPGTGSLVAPASAPTTPTTQPTQPTQPAQTPTASGITLAQISTHNSDASCWSAINGNVYDLTSWIPNHPGGENNIRRICGKDGSSDYSRQHGRSSRVATILAGFKIGTLAQ